MAYMPTIRVALDGVEVEVTLAQGDYVRAEAAGYSFEKGERPTSSAMACVSYHALCRAKRKGLIDVEIPASFDDYLDDFAFTDEQPEETDPKGSSQGQATG